MKASATAILKRLSQPEQSKFEQLVDEALTIYRSLVASSSKFGDARDEKMSARGFLKEALHNARTTQEKIEALDKVVEKLPEDGNEQLFRFLGTATQQATATRMDKGVNLRPPVGNLHRLVGGDSTEYVGVIVQSNMLGSNPFEIIALAALRATRDHPENFGAIDDWKKHHDALEEKQARLAAIYSEIAANWRDADVTFSDIGSDGRAFINVKFRDIVVPAAPPEALGERLVMALL